ncbi:BadF/BadG/BcrA/BcrD ATPase family protein [Brachybacterium phenoliresistens]|uniref:ATPase BadF/BadG/BcrA/BcrD type domain-containing protein n=1 Tax=Brachybacterium phenoliresistens TaxID=396014 RepID=Z9JN81_9MICO|nr:BadF/BadG/BcrA/BcrD ATPase family protein [Brachybacterium phenoliresistens]EWS79619.1 hypothetical protein BF93_12820 [Brachybacterium phenoliresistens]
MSAESPFVIAVDAGGTHTRVGCYALDGRQLSRVSGAGGSPMHNDDAAENVARAIRAALAAAGLAIEDAAALGVGTAGYEREGSNQSRGKGNAWVEEVYGLPGLQCPRVIVNDAVIAHRGALGGAAGIVVVAGTGSMILAIDEQGREVESGQFEHYAGAARHLAFSAMHRVLAGDAEAGDPFVARALERFGAADVPALRAAVLALGGTDRQEVKRIYGGLAPVITALAGASATADAALADLVGRTVDGIALLVPLIAARPVPVALTGSLALSDAFTACLTEQLRDRGVAAEVVPAAADPLGGAALLALDAARTAAP